MKKSFTLQSILDKKIKTSEKIILADLIIPVERNKVLPEGTTIILSSLGKLTIRKTIKEIPNNGKFNMYPLLLNNLAEEKGITSNYLQWFFGLKEINNYISENATGTVFIKVPQKIIHNLLIPVPKYNFKVASTKEIVIEKEQSEFKTLIDQFYNDYLINLGKGLYSTCIILAAAITETIIYQLLIEEGVDKKILENDRSLGLGKLITYLKLLQLDCKLDIPITHLVDLQKKRNSVVHVGLAIKKSKKYDAEDLKCFDEIIKYFGI